MTGEPDGDQAVQGLTRDADLTRANSLAREIFSDIANKWALLITEVLGDRTLRFSELRDEIEGIRHKMLTQNLHLPERNGLVERTVYPTVPPRVEYTWTEPGHALRVTIDGLCDWTKQYLARSRTRAGASRGPDGKVPKASSGPSPTRPT